MFKALLDANVARVLRRIEQGDCPIEPPLSVETLEHMVQDLVSATQPATSQEGEEQVLIPREPTEAMMDAGLYHSSHDAEWSDVNQMWKAMFDAVALDGGCSTHALAATPTPPTLSEDLRELVEALEPFAAACNITTAEDSESLYDSLAAEKLTWRDLRRARAALAQVKAS